MTTLPALLPNAEIVRPDFEANALRRYSEGYELLVRWLARMPMTADERAAAMRASFTRQRLMNNAGLRGSGDVA